MSICHPLSIPPDISNSNEATCTTRFKTITPGDPWLAPENHLDSLRDLPRFATKLAEQYPPSPAETYGFSIVGDVVFTDDDPTFVIDGNEIPLTIPNAAILRLLLRHYGQVVPRTVLSRAETKQNKELYLNEQIGELRKALGPNYRHRIVTVKIKDTFTKKSSKNEVDERNASHMDFLSNAVLL